MNTLEGSSFGMALHNHFLMGKLAKEYILTLSMKLKPNPCPIFTTVDGVSLS